VPFALQHRNLSTLIGGWQGGAKKPLERAFGAVRNG